MKKDLRAAAAILLALVLCVSCLTGCAGRTSASSSHEVWHPQPPASSATSDPVPSAEQDPASGAAPVQTPADPDAAPDPTETEKPATQADASSTKTERPAPQAEDLAPKTEKSAGADAPVDLDLASVQGVTRLKDLVGNYAMDLFSIGVARHIFVDTEDAHNPYDLTWRYGPDVKRTKEVNDPAWDSLYRAYVDACDWSLVFDADYYKKAFPMLAKLYHEDDALLLEHFQTQGVHEGRQASADFNVAAYRANCDADLAAAFGEDLECYYFYYMLNQDTQGGVDAANRDGAYPRWLTLELSLQQASEYRMVNYYREEAGVDPVELHPEIIALANYRAWNDAEYNVYAHDWTSDPGTGGDVNDCLWRLGRDHFAENTLKRYHTSSKTGMDKFAIHYALSPDHYEAMVSGEYFYGGYSNPYWSDNPDNPYAENADATDTGYVCQFDLFTETAPTSPYTLD